MEDLHSAVETFDAGANTMLYLMGAIIGSGHGTLASAFLEGAVRYGQKKPGQCLSKIISDLQFSAGLLLYRLLGLLMA